MEDITETDIPQNKKWFVINPQGVRQHAGLITEQQADKLCRKLLDESAGKGAPTTFTKRQQLLG